MVLKIVAGQLSVTAAAAEYGISRQHLHQLLARYREDGLEAVEPRSRAPLTNPQHHHERVRTGSSQLRQQLDRVAGWMPVR